MITLSQGKGSLWVAVLLLFSLALGINRLNPMPSENPDSAHYIVLAKSLSSEFTYRDINTPEENNHTKWPPLFPALLAPIMYVLGLNFFIMKTLVISFALLSVFFVYSLFKEKIGQGGALFAAFLAASYPPFVFYSAEIMSDVPYLAASTGAIIYTLKSAEDASYGNIYISSLFVIASYLLRTAGLILLSSVIVFLILDCVKKSNPRKVILLLLLVIPPYLLWQLRLGSFGEIRTEFHFEYLSVLNILANIKTYNELFGAMILPFRYIGRLNGFDVLYPFITIMVLFGVYISFARNGVLFGIYFIANVLVVLLWRFPGERYLLPVLPFAVYFFLLSASYFFSVRQIKKIFVCMIFPAIAFLHLISNDVSWGAFKYTPQDYDLMEIKELSLWTKKNTPENSLVAASFEHIFYLWSDRKAIEFPSSADSKILMDFIRKLDVDYIAVDSYKYGTTAQYLKPAMTSLTDDIERVYSNKGASIYRVKDSDDI